jgi:hypothetical protein
MKRALVFLLLAPILSVLAAEVAHGGSNDLLMLTGGFVLFCSLIVSAVSGVVDSALVQEMPISLRAPCIAIVGAIIAVGLMGGRVSQLELTVVAVGGALCMGLCSLLSHNYRRRHLQ